ncbi:FACR117Wp [Eremothecium gossypii FDAG1]|nr:FACR117Wp [Eremothecium gossypii FDAG1]
MAFMFKPPEQRKRNEKSPRLSLPSTLIGSATPAGDEHASGALGNSIGSDLHREQKLRGLGQSVQIAEQLSAGSTDTAGSDVLSQHAPSSASSQTSKVLPRRPVPPGMPALAFLSKHPYAQQVTGPLPTTSGEKAGSHSGATTLSAGPTRPPLPKLPYLHVEPKLPCEELPYSALHAGSSSSSNIHSPSRALQEMRLISAGSTPVEPVPPAATVPPCKDVDELEEEMWTHVHLKDQIEELGVLGEGAGGSVTKCKLRHGSKIFALKTITTLTTDQESQKQIFRELQFNKSCKSDYIVRYYGMFTDEEHSSIYIAMEYMGGRSLDAIYKHLLKHGGRVGEKVLGKIAESVLRGLSYLHQRKIIHRDIKPQNILLNEAGQVKLCDFGVSGEAVNSLATTFTGTSYYMAPERIQGQPYSVTSDVWSLGLTLLEVAQAHFPFDSGKFAANMPPIELLMLILTFTPQLKDEPEANIVWSKAFKSFISYCLKKESRERPSPRQMLRHPWIQGQMKKRVNMEKFIYKCWQAR